MEYDCPETGTFVYDVILFWSILYPLIFFVGAATMFAGIIHIHANSVILVHDFIHATSLK